MAALGHSLWDEQAVNLVEHGGIWRQNMELSCGAKRRHEQVEEVYFALIHVRRATCYCPTTKVRLSCRLRTWTIKDATAFFIVQSSQAEGGIVHYPGRQTDRILIR
jgi:hypothetical protein